MDAETKGVVIFLVAVLALCEIAQRMLKERADVKNFDRAIEATRACKRRRHSHESAPSIRRTKHRKSPAAGADVNPGQG